MLLGKVSFKIKKRVNFHTFGPEPLETYKKFQGFSLMRGVSPIVLDLGTTATTFLPNYTERIEFF